MKKFLKRIKNGFEKIHGTKGIISIFLALIMVPFATMADLVVEVGRYRDAMSIMDEVMDSASVSTLSKFDKYLKDRFGLLAVDQLTDTEKLFNKYMSMNLDTASGWKLPDNSVKVQGIRPLSDNMVLLSQINEISKFTVPTALAGITLGELASNIKGLSNISKFLSPITSMGGVVDATATVVNDIQDLENMAKGLETSISEYNSAYNDFKSKVAALAGQMQKVASAKAAYDEEQRKYNAQSGKLTELQSQIDDIKDSIEKLDKDLADNKISQSKYDTDRKDYDEQLKDLQDAYDKEAENLTANNTELQNAKNKYQTELGKIQGYIDDVNTSKGTYATKIGELSSHITEYSNQADSLLEDCNSAFSATADFAGEVGQIAADHDEYKKSLEEQIGDYDKQIASETNSKRKAELQEQQKEAKNKLSEINTNNSNVSTAYSSATSEIDDINSELKESLKDYSSKEMQTCAATLNRLKPKVSGYDATKVTTSTTISDSEYHPDVRGYSSSAAIAQAIAAAEATSKNASAWDIIKGMIGFFNSLIKTQHIFDPTLNAYITTDAGYAPSEMDMVLSSMSKMIQSVQGIIDGIKDLNLFKLWDSIKSLISSTISFITNLINYLVGLVTRLVESLVELANPGQKVLLDEFLVLSLSNRTDNDSARQMIGGSSEVTGYSFKNVEFCKSASVNSVPALGTLTAIVNLLADVATDGSDHMFCGAELEYILIGSKSEIVNQVATFFELYFVRMLFNLPTIFLIDHEVQTLATAAAAAAGVGTAIVYALYVILEPLADTLLLVNGGKIDIIKFHAFFTVQGIPKLLGGFVSVKINDIQKGDLQENVKKAFKFEGDLPDSSGFEFKFGFKYDQYLFMLMIVFGENNTYLNRFKNIIQLEARAYYSKADADAAAAGKAQPGIIAGKDFNINNTYTYIDATVTGKFVPLLPIGDVVINSFLGTSRRLVRGY